MSDEISQAIQIIRLEFDGLRFGMDVTGGTVKQAKNLAVFIYALLTREKLQGKTSLKKMLSKDGSLQVLKIREEDMKKFKKLAKKYGKKVIAFAGAVQRDARACNDAGIDAFFPILRGVVTLEEAMKSENAKRNLADTAEQVIRLMK